jgi:hypothetical protein
MRRHLPDLIVVAFFLLGCGPQEKATAQGSHRGHPEISILKPRKNDEVRPKQEITIEGSVEVKENTWTPQVVLVKILQDEQGRIVHGTWGVELKPKNESGSYSFEKKLQVPPSVRPGLHFIQVLAIGPAPRETESKSGSTKVGTPPRHSARIEIRVK